MTFVLVVIIGTKIETKNIMFLACDNWCLTYPMKMFELWLRVRGETVLNEYQVVWWRSQWSETTSRVRWFFSDTHTLSRGYSSPSHPHPHPHPHLHPLHPYPRWRTMWQYFNKVCSGNRNFIEDVHKQILVNESENLLAV